ncbi:unnamed protein product [Spirodela intermedia]|uniref:Uncharacterized protein n=1 Tax=Spirodela intermedia TaxID=51605 RepID=A0A7I8L8F6_SPIIN|nr:unnamed protein product [Spirodela intermedia]
MRRLGRLAGAAPSTTIHPFVASSSHAYSTFSGGGRGRGRGGASPPPPIAPGKPQHGDGGDEEEAPSGSSGIGHGRGTPPLFPSFSWTSTLTPPPQPSAAGRGRASPPPPPSPPPGTGRGRGAAAAEPPRPSDPAAPKRPIFFRREDYSPDQFLDPDDGRKPSEAARVPLSFDPPRGGMGRGKGSTPAAPAPATPEENRHLRPRSPSDQSPRRSPARQRPPAAAASPTVTDRAEATKKAMDVLSRGGRGQGGRGMRGRGEGGGMGWRGRGGRFGGRGRGRDPDEYYGTGLFLGDNADGEKLAKRLGEENMAKLKDAFEEMSSRVLPSPMEECYLEALHTNYSFEFEPEYHMVFANPDVDEKPPIPLPEALEKMKPFLMEYEGIKSQQEWEDVVKETMEKAPVLKELVDFYSGPDRVTAKQQHQELERVANTLPENIPSSVRRFTDRAMLSLKNNPGWGFGKKCQFMDKLTWEISQQYK